MIINQDSISNYVIANGSGISNTAGVFTIASSGNRTALLQPYSLSNKSVTSILISALVRLTAGTKGRFVAYSADTHDMSTAVLTVNDTLDITSTEWKQITIKVTYPIGSHVLALCGFEVVQGEVSTIEVKDIHMNVLDGLSQSKPELVACGLVQKGAGVAPSINVDFPNFNIDAVTFNGTDEITVTLNVTSTQRKRLLITGGSTPDYPHPALIGSVVAGNKTSFKIKFPNYEGGFVDISNQTVYIAFQAHI